MAGALIRLVAPDHEGTEHLRWFFGGGGADGEPPGPWDGADVELRCEITDAPEVRTTEPPSSVNGPVSRWDIGDTTILHHLKGRSAHVTARRITLEPARPGVPAWLTCRQLLAEATSCWWARRSDLVLHAALRAALRELDAAQAVDLAPGVLARVQNAQAQITLAGMKLYEDLPPRFDVPEGVCAVCGGIGWENPGEREQSLCIACRGTGEA